MREDWKSTFFAKATTNSHDSFWRHHHKKLWLNYRLHQYCIWLLK
jgi:hypothetical protein